MKISENGIQTIKQNEGFSAVPYPDNKGVSIGYGHYMGTGISVNNAPIQHVTEDEATGLMMNDLIPVQSIINRNFNFNLTQKHYDALADLGYNAGSGNLQKMIDLMLQNRLSDAIDFILNDMDYDRRKRDTDNLLDFTLGGVETVKANVIPIIFFVLSIIGYLTYKHIIA